MNQTALIHGDCMEYMARCEDKFFDLAIVDPPYGIARFGNRVESSNRVCGSAKLNSWDVKPSAEYFDELFRISEKQIIWGANNFSLPSTEYFIIWNKQQTVKNFASAEYAWTSIKQPAQVFTHSIHKCMATRKAEGGKIHPTQKPVSLYKWLLNNYAKPGQRILDTHLGSGSSAIAAHYFGCDFVGIEIDEDYHKAAKGRFDKSTRQLALF